MTVIKNPLHHQSDLHTVLVDIIEGRIVKRSRHHLVYNNASVADLFIKALIERQYKLTTVGDTTITPGERIPAFYLKDDTAYFGWIFWEKFSQLRLRKLFGTVVRNAKGDWLIQIPSNSTTSIYANTAQVFEMDIDRPFDL